MTINRIYDSIYIIPAILDYLDKPTDEALAILYSNGITDEVITELSKQQALLQYHQCIIENKFKSDPKLYPLLRKGLKQYYNQYLSGIFQKLNIVKTTWQALDYGCGDGQMSDQFLKDNPHANIIRVDREPGKNILTVDFETNPAWFQQYMNSLDLVIMSELLHCKELSGQEYIIRSADAMLKSHGKALIVENIDYCMAFRISRLKKKVHKVVTESDVEHLAQLVNWKKIAEFQINRHKIYLYEKI